jgi:hypothetical protein
MSDAYTCTECGRTYVVISLRLDCEARHQREGE